MKFSDAIKASRESLNSAGPTYNVVLACGFTPQYLDVFISAYLYQYNPGKSIAITPGPYGNILEAIKLAEQTNSHALVILLEWSNLDPRLGYRSTGGWTRARLDDVIDQVESRLDRLRSALQAIGTQCRVSLSLPTLSLPPCFHTTDWQASATELRLHQLVLDFVISMAEHKNVAVLSPHHIERNSPYSDRHDLEGEFHADIPFNREHVSQLAKAIASCLTPPPPKKGLITDLDDTLWSGLVGETGPENVTWDLDSGTHIHAVYQQLLESIADTGGLLAIASKNQKTNALAALERPDLLISKEMFYPIETGWNPKSEMVAHILETWNIDASDVVFVDDTPMELEEVKRRFPEINCALFPANDVNAAAGLFRDLRSWFGKVDINEEDHIRQKTIQQNAQRRDAVEGVSSIDDFLEESHCKIELNSTKKSTDSRPFELFNKTNQFNLNGRRMNAGEWQHMLEDENCFLNVISYSDRFGSLGRIGLIFGRYRPDVVIDGWVLSCRAFSRRVEYAMLAQVFDRFDTDRITLDYQETPKNLALQAFLQSIGLDLEDHKLVVNRETFMNMCPPLHLELINSD